MNRQDLSKVIMKYKLDLVFNNLNRVLLLIVILLAVILLVTHLPKSNNNSTDVSVTGIPLGGDCKQAKTGCDSGLSCVEADTDVFRCSNLKNFYNCDKTSKQCTEGKCINTAALRTDGKNYHFCTLGQNQNYCGVDTDCTQGFKCEKFSFTGEGRCTPTEISARKNSIFCNSDAGCASGFKCVLSSIVPATPPTGQGIKFCSDQTKGQKCDSVLKQCASGLTCIAVDFNTSNSNLDYICADGKEDSGCIQQSDCQSGFICTNVEGRNNKVCTIGDRTKTISSATLCSKTNTAVTCAAGQTCVNQNPQGAFFCSAGGNFEHCDAAGTGCQTGLKCINIGPGTLAKTNFYRCTTGENNTFCTLDSDCKDATFKCVNIEGINERRCVKKNQEEVIAGALCDSVVLCKAGLKCVKPYDTRSNTGLCSDGEKMQVCLVSSDCKSGLTCKTAPDTQFIKKCQENPSVACGAMDVDSNNTIDFKDFSKFISVWKLNCSDSPQTAACGGMDSDNNSLIDQKDFFTFVSKWKKPSCTN